VGFLSKFCLRLQRQRRAFLRRRLPARLVEYRLTLPRNLSAELVFGQGLIVQKKRWFIDENNIFIEKQEGFGHGCIEETRDYRSILCVAGTIRGTFHSCL